MKLIIELGIFVGLLKILCVQSLIKAVPSSGYPYIFSKYFVLHECSFGLASTVCRFLVEFTQICFGKKQNWGEEGKMKFTSSMRRKKEEEEVKTILPVSVSVISVSHSPPI